jgi:hypothetical protein
MRDGVQAGGRRHEIFAVDHRAVDAEVATLASTREGRSRCRQMSRDDDDRVVATTGSREARAFATAGGFSPRFGPERARTARPRPSPRPLRREH